MIDADENGIITMDEFKKAWKELGLNAHDSAELLPMFRDVDMNGDGVIDYTEFIAACVDRRVKQQEEVCWAAFRVFDLNGSGNVSYEDLKHVLNDAALEKTFNKFTLQKLWHQLSGDG